MMQAVDFVEYTCWECGKRMTRTTTLTTATFTHGEEKVELSIVGLEPGLEVPGLRDWLKLTHAREAQLAVMTDDAVPCPECTLPMRWWHVHDLRQVGVLHAFPDGLTKPHCEFYALDQIAWFLGGKIHDDNSLLGVLARILHRRAGVDPFAKE